MLFGKYLSRCHKCGLTAIFIHKICRSCRNCGLTRTNVALNESVHRLFFLHISDTILYGGLLAVCKDKRQSVIKAVHILRFQHTAAFFTASAFHKLHTKLQNKKLVKDKAIFRKLADVHIFWKMYILQSIFKRTEIIPLHYAFWQRLIDILIKNIQGEPYCFSEHLLTKTLCEVIDRLDFIFRIGRKYHRRIYLFSHKVSCYPAAEVILFIHFKLFIHILAVIDNYYKVGDVIGKNDFVH